jgi:hypothetical protein
MQFDPGNTYNLEEGNGKTKLGAHLSEPVEVTGWESPALLVLRQGSAERCGLKFRCLRHWDLQTGHTFFFAHW